jgi:2-aminoethylphosphonate-pyruvate transaminase
MILLIPGPVTTRAEVRAAMALDYAPWDDDFRAISRQLRQRVCTIAGGDPVHHTALPLQGCGHFGMEAAVRSTVAPGGKILIPMSGSYAERMSRLVLEAGRVPVPLSVDQRCPVPPGQITEALRAHPDITHLGLVYSETSSGVINDAPAIGAAVHAEGRRMLLDAVSAFAALPLELSKQPEIDAVVFTSNKCLEGLPGLVFVIVRNDSILPLGQAGSWSFDLADILAQSKRDGGGSFRFTPAAQAVAAFGIALDLYEVEGGQKPRLARYRDNADVLFRGMIDIGLRPCLEPENQGPIVVNIHAPPDPAWSLPKFVASLKHRKFTISNFYNTVDPSFRVGCIGDVTSDDMRRFVVAVDEVLKEIGVIVRRGN